MTLTYLATSWRQISHGNIHSSYYKLENGNNVQPAHYIVYERVYLYISLIMYCICIIRGSSLIKLGSLFWCKIHNLDPVNYPPPPRNAFIASLEVFSHCLGFWIIILSSVNGLLKNIYQFFVVSLSGTLLFFTLLAWGIIVQVFILKTISVSGKRDTLKYIVLEI